jgi:hypothetical protein
MSLCVCNEDLIHLLDSAEALAQRARQGSGGTSTGLRILFAAAAL